MGITLIDIVGRSSNPDTLKRCLKTTKNLYDDAQTKIKVLQIITAANQPVSIDYIAHHLNVSWATARIILFNLTMLGELNVTRTTSNFVFSLKDKVNTKARIPTE